MGQVLQVLFAINQLHQLGRYHLRTIRDYHPCHRLKNETGVFCIPSLSCFVFRPHSFIKTFNVFIFLLFLFLYYRSHGRSSTVAHPVASYPRSPRKNPNDQKYLSNQVLASPLSPERSPQHARKALASENRRYLLVRDFALSLLSYATQYILF